LLAHLSDCHYKRAVTHHHDSYQRGEETSSRDPGRRQEKRRGRYKVLKQVHPDTGISNKVMGIMNSLSTTFSSALQQRLHMAHHNKRPTVSSYEINIAVRLLLHGSSLLDAAGVNANFSRIMSIVSSKAQWRRAFRQHETVEPLMRSDRNALTGGEDD